MADKCQAGQQNERSDDREIGGGWELTGFSAEVARRLFFRAQLLKILLPQFGVGAVLLVHPAILRKVYRVF